MNRKSLPLKQPETRYDVVVIGGGPVGLTASCLIARIGANVALLPGYRLTSDRKSRFRAHDPRTTALMRPTLRLLEHLGLWPGALEAVCAPLWALRLVDDTKRAITALPITFDARELGNEPFGWNIPNEPLVACLTDSVLDMADRIDVPSTTPIAGVYREPSGVIVNTGDGISCRAKLVVAADGRSSLMRRTVGIETTKRNYHQAALATTFDHEQPHGDTSIEHHRPHGPLTTVPLPGRRSSLIWMETPRETERLMALSPQDFCAALERALGGELGRISQLGSRRSFPSVSMIARRFARNRVMLMGEAAHVCVPIGAQGLNMGLRDAATASELIDSALKRDLDPGSDALLADFDRRRRRDVLPRQLAIDLLNQMLLSDLLPAQLLRASGVFALSAMGALRRFVMREGLVPGHEAPRLMCG